MDEGGHRVVRFSGYNTYCYNGLAYFTDVGILLDMGVLYQGDLRYITNQPFSQAA